MRIHALIAPALPLIFIAIPLVAPAAAKPAQAPETRICLRNDAIISQRVSGDPGYFVQTRQGWWRNTATECASFGPNRFAVTQSLNNQQCRGDVVNLLDRSSRLNFGGCKLGEWEKVAEADVPPPFNH